MPTPFPAKSAQIVAGTAVVLALLGGAYAIGRSQNSGYVPPPEAVHTAPAAAARNEADRVVAQVAQVAPQREAPVPVRVSPAPVSREDSALARLCSSCGLVTDVHTESRRGEGSGVGAVGGAVVGGLLGNMVGGGNGRKLATVGGAVAGGYAGNEIEKSQRSYSVWVINVKERDGRMRRFERRADPGLRAGDEVQLHDGGFSAVR